MRNTLLIIRREYIERVRTKAFIIFTILTPLFMSVVILGPAKLINMKSQSTRNLVVVASSQATGDLIKHRLQGDSAEQTATQKELSDDSNPAPTYAVETRVGGGDELRDQLTQDVNAGKIDGFVWLTDKDIADRKFIYSTKHASDFVDFETVRSAVNGALTRARLVAGGIPADKVEDALKRLDMDVVRIEKGGKSSKTGGFGAIMLPFMLMFMIYITVLIYGIAVMRSVLEEKTSRVMEVMLSSANATQMMAGKIIGVGAVGITQLLIWVGCSAALTTGIFAFARPFVKDLQISPLVYIFFPVFFILGYLLYSSMYAAIGAMVNSEEEGQQMQFIIMMPLILCTVFAWAVIRDPGSSLSFWASMFPLTSPIIMFLRITVQQPSMPQILSSIVILVLGIAGMVWLSSRIYRVGILMYGKRPTLPEIVKWIKYA